MFHHGTSEKPATLPKTIEEATRRYLYTYHTRFKGAASEMVRLKNLTQAFIYRLRKVAPRFYEEKLPTFINQACSSLLICDTSTKQGEMNFHQTHGIFMQLLDEFRKSQPSGEVDFANERRRYDVKKELLVKHEKLVKRLAELEAVEFEGDEIGDDEDPASDYAKLMADMDQVQRDLNSVAMELAIIEGVDLEGHVDFKLKISRTSVLNQLTKDELLNLEKQMSEFYNAHKEKTALFVDIGLIEGMFAKLHIDPGRFMKVTISTMQKDALDAYRDYFRSIEREDRAQRFDELLKKSHLVPREGAILDPNDLPNEVREKLETNDEQARRLTDELMQTFGDRQLSEKELGDELQDSGDEEVDEKTLIYERLRLKGIKYERVKEEPRDDCKPSDLESDDDLDNVSETSDGTRENNNILAITDGQADDLQEVDEIDDFNEDRSEGGNPRKVAKIEDLGSDGQNNTDERSSSVAEDDDDDIECLGTVEPTDKINIVQLSEE